MIRSPERIYRDIHALDRQTDLDLAAVEGDEDGVCRVYVALYSQRAELWCELSHAAHMAGEAPVWAVEAANLAGYSCRETAREWRRLAGSLALLQVVRRQ